MKKNHTAKERALAWLCVVVMLAMMVPITAFGESPSAEQDGQADTQPAAEQDGPGEDTPEEPPAEPTGLTEEPEPVQQAEEPQDSAPKKAVNRVSDPGTPTPILSDDGVIDVKLDGSPNVSITDGATIEAQPGGSSGSWTYDDATITIEADPHYELPTEKGPDITVTGPDDGGVTYTSGDKKTGTITIKGDALGTMAQGGVYKITIAVTAAAETHKLTWALDGVTATVGEAPAEATSDLTYGTDFKATLAASSDKQLPMTIQVQRGSETLDAAEYTYERSTGAFSIGGEKLTDDITVTVKAVKDAAEGDYVINGTKGAPPYEDWYTDAVTIEPSSGRIAVVAPGADPTGWTDSFAVPDRENTYDIYVSEQESEPFFYGTPAQVTLKVDTDTPAVSSEALSSSFVSTVKFTVTEKNFDPNADGAYTATLKLVDGDEQDMPEGNVKWTDNDNGTWTATLTMPADEPDGEYEFSLTVTDKVGKKSNTAKAGPVTVDSVPPQVTGVISGVEPQEDGCYYIKSAQDLPVSFTVKEKHFVPDEKGSYLYDGFTALPEQPWQQAAEDYTFSGTFPGATESKSEGKYTLSLTVTDQADLEGEGTLTVVIDGTAPTISGITYNEAAAGSLTMDGKTWGVYSQKQVTGSFTVTDKLSPIGEVTVSGVKAGSVSVGKSEPDGAGGYKATVTFTADAQFKDQLTVTAADILGNTATAAPSDDNANGGNLLVDTAAPAVNFNNPDYSGVHRGSYNLSVTCADPENGGAWSGLKSVSYAVKRYASAGSSETSTLSEGTLYGGGGAQRQTTGSVTLQGSLNSNLVFVEVTVTDNAGNVNTVRSGNFKMDAAAPQVTVSYNNNSARNSRYFNAARTATVTVKDKNFSASGMSIRTGGSVGRWSAGTDTDGDGLPDTYTCSISYSGNSDYTLAISGTDQAGNTAQVDYTGTAPRDFTVDTVAPRYAVSFADGARSLSGKGYSQGELTVTLRVTERNFDAAAATAGLTVLRDGQDISASVRGRISWSGSGEVRTATFTLPDDGEYTVSMSFMDLAGNRSTGEQGSAYVDQSDPVVTITGVANQSANREQDIHPVVTVSDKYYDANGVSIHLYNGLGEDVTDQYLTGAGISAVTYDARNDTYTQTFTFDNLDKDDIYRIVAVATDQSGRTNSYMLVLNAAGEQTQFSLEGGARMQFSVNRSGSAYSAPEETLALLGQYVQEARNVHILETNVDTLDPESIHITLTHDSNTRELVYGTDFTYSDPTEETESGWHIYEYVFSDSLFAEDGRYTITIYSVDAAGNISQNDTQEKNFELTFTVDKTPPIYVATDLEAGAIYSEESKTVTINASDNIALDSVRVFRLDSTAEKDENGDYIWYTVAPDGSVTYTAEEVELTPVESAEGDYTLTLTEGETAAQSRQSLLVVCTDKAGNQNEQQEILDFTVSSSFWVRFYANKPLFYGSIGGVAALTILAGVILLRAKDSKKRGGA